MHRVKTNLAFSLFLIPFLLPAGAIAKSTTQTTVSIIGKVAPGASITVRTTVTGSHIIFMPPYYSGTGSFPGSVPGGSVDIYADGVKVLGVPAQVNNSSYSCGYVYAPPSNTICYGPLTVVDYGFTIPKGVSSKAFYAEFTGDHDSNQSTSAVVSVAAAPPVIAPAIDFMLN
ncbi:hypothetical protein ACPPVV_10725 [Rhodanobacter sp. Col0626]|uniref:hypothetical protein n=1 Tax=Rhodanobacter sp. Col0626 TaxID=3415679 RepID=UPI003CF4189B